MRPFLAACLAVLAACAGGAARAQGVPPGGDLPPARIVALPGVDLLVRDTGGAGVPIVLLHANTGTSESWAFQYDALGRAGYRVLAFDRRGWGGSRAQAGAGPSSIAGDIDALATALNLPPFHLVSVAAGGAGALDYLAWHPERVRSAVVAASTGLVSDPPFVAFGKRIEIPALAAAPASDVELGASYRGTDPAGAAAWAAIEAHSRQPGVPALPALRSPNTVAKLEGIAVPLLAVAADADLLAPPALVRMWADHVRGHAWAVVEGSGHSVAWEQPDAFNGLVLDFIAKH